PSRPDRVDRLVDVEHHRLAVVSDAHVAPPARRDRGVRMVERAVQPEPEPVALAPRGVETEPEAVLPTVADQGRETLTGFRTDPQLHEQAVELPSEGGMVARANVLPSLEPKHVPIRILRMAPLVAGGPHG